MIRVTIRFYADLKERYSPGQEEGVVPLDLEEGSRVSEVFKELNIDDREIGFLLRDDEKVQKDAELRDGDLIHFFSFAAGG